MGFVIGLDGGGTATRAALYADNGAPLAEATGGPANPVGRSLDAVSRMLVSLCRDLLAGRGAADVAAAGIAGCSREFVRRRIAHDLAAAGVARRVLVTDDLRPLLFANAGRRPAVVAVSGTGSSVLVQPADADPVLVGGKGPVLGDDGSSYRVAFCALRAAAAADDGTGPATILRDVLLAVLSLASYTEVAVWAAGVSPTEIAGLARVVVRAAADGDAVADAIVQQEARALAHVVICARRRFDLDTDAPVFLNGGLFEYAMLFAETFRTTVHDASPGVRIELAPVRGHAAAAALARAEEGHLPAGVSTATPSSHASALTPTEKALDDGCFLDEMTPLEIVRHMNKADARCIDAVRGAGDAIARVMAAAGGALARGGRLIYLGAGTSGRIGVLDASECPPTFGVPPDTVIGIMAGGDRALRKSCEGAEDDGAQAVIDLRALQPQVGPRDVVVGIAASGTTPYVLAALSEARCAGAVTALLCCNPAATADVDTVIALDTGPEVLTGSTRLKAGTATKMALNMISTGAMALSGRVYRGLMIGVQATNVKLRDRAVRITAQLTGATPETVRPVLEAAAYSIPAAVLMLQKGWTRDEANRRLRDAKGDLRGALDDA